MFWGLHVKSTPKSNEPIEYNVSETIKISQAVLEPLMNKVGKKNRNSSGGTPSTPSSSGYQGPVSLVLEQEGKKFILCTLDSSKVYQCPLDLFFRPGSTIKLSLQGGHGTVHLSGYQLTEEDSDDDDMVDSDEDAVNEEAMKRWAAIKKKSGMPNGKQKSRKKIGGDDDDDDDDEDDDDDAHHLFERESDDDDDDFDELDFSDEQTDEDDDDDDEMNGDSDD